MSQPAVSSCLLLAAAVLFGCSDGDAPRVSESTMPVVTPGPSPAATPEITPGPTSLLPPIPEDWPTYTEPAGQFNIQYPIDWFEIDGDLFSYDPRVDTGPGYELDPESIKIEIAFNPVAESIICGAQSVNPAGDVMSRLPEATATTLGGKPAWQLVRTDEDSDLQGATRIQAISLVYGKQCVKVVGYFTQKEPDVVTFLQIASTFEFKS